MGEKAYADLASISKPADVMPLFRRSQEVMLYVRQAIHIGAKVVWMQEGLRNEEAARTAGLELQKSDTHHYDAPG